MVRVAKRGRSAAGKDVAQRVLVAHTWAGIADVTDRMLSEAGYDCRHASTRANVSRLLKKRIQFDVLFLHVGALEDFPRLRRWAERGAGKEIPVVLNAARPRKSIPANILNRANVFLPTPFLREQLLRAMRKVLAKK